MTLFIRPIMNSSVEEIFLSKHTVECGAQSEPGDSDYRKMTPVYVQSCFDLMDPSGVHRVETLMPHGTQRIASGETIAFYCTMDESLWTRAQEIVFHDTEGKEHSLRLV
jgi:hypothetical protein